MNQSLAKVYSHEARASALKVMHEIMDERERRFEKIVFDIKMDREFERTWLRWLKPLTHEQAKAVAMKLLKTTFGYYPMFHPARYEADRYARCQRIVKLADHTEWFYLTLDDLTAITQ